MKWIAMTAFETPPEKWSYAHISDVDPNDKASLRGIIAYQTAEYLAAGGKVIRYTSADNRAAAEDNSSEWKASRTRAAMIAQRNRQTTREMEAIVDHKKRRANASYS